MNKKTIIIVSLITLVILSTAGYAGFVTSKPETVIETPTTVTVTTCNVEQSVSAPGTLVNTHTVDIEMPANSKLDEIYVKPGDNIKAGQPLAKLANPASFAATTAAAELEALQAQKTLDELYLNATAKEAQLKVDLLNAQDELKKAENKRLGLNYPRASDKTLERVKGELAMAEQGYKHANDFYLSKSELDISHPERIAALKMLLDAQKQYNQAKANLNWYMGKPNNTDFAKADAEVEVAKAKVAEAQAALDRLEKGIDPIEEAQAKASLSEAQQKLEDAQQVEADGEIRAPFDGTVLEVSVRTGESIQAGKSIISFSDPKALEVKANITEEDYPLLAPGMNVELYFDARTDVTVEGKVERIVPKRIDGDRPLYNIYISLSEVPDGLVDGMTSDAAITIASREDVLCLPRAVVRASGGNEAAVKVWNGLQSEVRKIQVGLRGDTYVEILSGLKAGEQVVTK